jgi:hypothetical protein
MIVSQKIIIAIAFTFIATLAFSDECGQYSSNPSVIDYCVASAQGYGSGTGTSDSMDRGSRPIPQEEGMKACLKNWEKLGKGRFNEEYKKYFLYGCIQSE